MAAAAQSKTFRHIKYVGNRPKGDQDNRCREKLCHLVREVGCFYELVAEKLYLVYLANDEDPEKFCTQHSHDEGCPFILWGFQDSPNFHYEAFNADFGPFNLATTHQFCSKLKVWLDTQAFRESDKYIAIVLDDKNTKRKLNATLLVAVAAMVLLNLTDEEVLQRLDFFMTYKGKIGEPKKELVFREKKKFSDVSGNQSLMSLTLEDCIRAFYAALNLKFYDYYRFDHTEYLFYETVMSGDLNWIVPGKILAFAGPSDKPVQSRIYHKHSPQFYHQYFRDHNVTTIVRLNEPEYLSSGFSDHGFEHFDLIFPDGYPPTSTIAARFIRIVDEAKGAVAVHCYAGIGRTGTLIAAYLMARYDFTPQMAIAWTRICRPGSVIGEQQDWLFTKFDRYSIIKCSPPKSAKGKKTRPTILAEPAEEDTNLGKTTYADAEKTYGQAKALLLAKKQRDNYDRPCTRNSSLLKSLGESETSKNLQKKKADLVLNLGKTIPLMLNIEDLMELKGQLPKFYRLKDGKYEWKVKFPEPGYVALKYDLKKDSELYQDLPSSSKEIVFREPILEFKYEKEETDETGSHKSAGLQKMKPTVCFNLISWLET